MVSAVDDTRLIEQQSSEFQNSDQSRLGASVIKKSDLQEIIATIFDEEYDKNNNDKRVNARKARRTFDFEDENLNMLTECPVRIFEILDTFVRSDRQTWNQVIDERQELEGSLLDKSLSYSQIYIPSEISKAKLIEAIHTIEVYFISYSSDIIDRVIKDFRRQSGATESSSSF